MEAIDELAGALRRRLIERARAGESGGDIGGEIAALVEREAALADLRSNERPEQAAGDQA